MTNFVVLIVFDIGEKSIWKLIKTVFICIPIEISQIVWQIKWGNKENRNSSQTFYSLCVNLIKLVCISIERANTWKQFPHGTKVLKQNDKTPGEKICFDIKAARLLSRTTNKLNRQSRQNLKDNLNLQTWLKKKWKSSKWVANVVNKVRTKFVIIFLKWIKQKSFQSAHANLPNAEKDASALKTAHVHAKLAKRKIAARNVASKEVSTPLHQKLCFSTISIPFFTTL
jgi:hypothetical protein